MLKYFIGYFFIGTFLGLLCVDSLEWLLYRSRRASFLRHEVELHGVTRVKVNIFFANLFLWPWVLFESFFCSKKEQG